MTSQWKKVVNEELTTFSYYRLPPTSVRSFWIAIYVSLSTSYS